MTQPQTYYRDESDSDVSGILVLDTGDEGVRVTENRENGWCAPFWMPEQQFRANTHGDSIQEVGQVSDEQLEQVVSGVAA